MIATALTLLLVLIGLSIPVGGAVAFAWQGGGTTGPPGSGAPVTSVAPTPTPTTAVPTSAPTTSTSTKTPSPTKTTGASALPESQGSSTSGECSR